MNPFRRFAAHDGKSGVSRSRPWWLLVCSGALGALAVACSANVDGSGPTGGASGGAPGGTPTGGSGAPIPGAGGGRSGTGGAAAPGTGGAPAVGSGGAGTGTGGRTAGSGGASATGGATASGGASGTGGAGGGSVPVTGDRATAAGVCARWNADRANRSEGTWSGNFTTCDPGMVSADGMDNALRQFNLYRWLANLPPVTTDPARNAQAQACALIQGANWRTLGLSHSPAMSFMCWTQLGADGSASSNISGGPGVSSVDLYMLDTGNETTFGHRRIVLSNSLGPIGLGSTPSGSCMQNLRGTGQATNPWTAWPSPGFFPLQAIAPGRTTLDMTGWSVQSTGIPLAGAAVTVTSGGAPLAVTVSSLTGTYGGGSAIRIVPSGWTSQAGQTYTVNVTGISTPIQYSVSVVSCAP